MHIIVNGTFEEFSPGITVQDLILAKGLDPVRVVAELNREIVPGERFEDTKLADADRLELLQFVGGG